MVKSYAQYVKEHIVKVLPAEKTGGHWRSGDKGYPHICKKLEDNFLDLPISYKCSVKGNSFQREIKYHKDACSLNSSQVMCINFFKKFFESPPNEKILVEILRKSGLNIAEKDQIEEAIFEYEPDSVERTNFDFYLIMMSGTNISFEIKYTESEFGGISTSKDAQQKYKNKWEESYSILYEKCPYFHDSPFCDKQFECVKNGKMTPESCGLSKECAIFDFYSHYQISRNIVRAKKNTDIVVFLTPGENHSLDEGRSYIDHFKNDNIVNLHWENLLALVLECTSKDIQLNEYYTKFKRKYFEFVP